MSFPSSSGVLTPEEFEVVRGVYAAIAGEDWFTRSLDRREQFAATVVDLYRQGVRDPHDLALQCRSLALTKFGNGGLAH